MKRATTTLAAITAFLLLTACSSEQTAHEIAEDLAPAGSTVETITEGHQFGYVLDAEEPPSSAAIFLLPEEQCADKHCGGIVTVETGDMETIRKTARYMEAIIKDGGDDTTSITVKGRTMLHLFGISDLPTRILIEADFDGEPV